MSKTAPATAGAPPMFKKLKKKFSKTLSKVTKNPLFGAALSMIPGVGGIAAIASQVASKSRGLKARVAEMAPQLMPELEALSMSVKQEQTRRRVEPNYQPKSLVPQLRKLEEIATAVPPPPDEMQQAAQEAEEIEEEMTEQDPEFTFTDAFIELDAAACRCKYS